MGWGAILQAILTILVQAGGVQKLKSWLVDKLPELQAIGAALKPPPKPKGRP